MFYRDLLIDISDILSIFGAYLGICLDAVYLGGTPQNFNVSNSKCKALGRFLLVFLLWHVPQLLCKWICNQTQNDADSYMMEMVILSMPSFFGTMALFSVVKVLFKKLGLLRRSEKR